MDIKKIFLKKQPFLFNLRLILVLILLVLILMFLYLKIVPFGRISYSRSWPRGLASGKGFIIDFKPFERIDSVDKNALKIIGEPVYFSLFTPRTFNEAEMTIRYIDHLESDSTIIEAGVLKDKLSGYYDLRPIQNDVLDGLRFSWPRLEDESERLILQAERYYSSVTEFEADLAAGRLKDCPADLSSCLAVYNYPINLDYVSPDYQRLSPLVISQPLRGTHQFYVYLKKGTWRFKFNFVDLNQDEGLDPVIVDIFLDREKISSGYLPDLGPETGNGKTEMKELILTGENIQTGIYRAVVRVNDDIVISRIESPSDKLSFINKIWPVSGPGSLSVFTDANYLQAKTTSPASLGQIIFDGKKLELADTYEQFLAESEGGAGIREVRAAKDDIVLENSGVFAFNRDSLINASVPKISRYFRPNDSLRYVVASYERPLFDKGVKTARVKFDLRDAYREEGKYTFLISVPGLGTNDGAEDYLEIKEIKIELKGRTLWQKIFR